MNDDTLIGFILNHPIRLVVYTLCAALGHFIFKGVRAWWKEWSSKKCRSGHNKKYVELAMYTNYDCKDHFRVHSENDEWWGTKARWVCQEPDCTAYGWDCFGTRKVFWKIEHGKVVHDKKLMESPPTDIQPPKQTMAHRRAEAAKVKSQGTKELTFDEVFKATEQAILKNVSRVAEEIEGKHFAVQKQSMCDCGCECDPMFTAGLGELPRPKCDPLRHPQHHDIDVILAAKKKWAEAQNAKVCYKVAEKAKNEQSAKEPKP